MKSITTDIVASERNEAFKNIIAITVQPSKVVVMQRVIARHELRPARKDRQVGAQLHEKVRANALQFVV